MNNINMTPHPIHLMDSDKNVTLMIPASGNLIRLAVKSVVDSTITFNGVEVTLTKTVYGDPVELPEEQEGIFYVVSQLVKSALPNRADLLVPAEVQRDVEGNIIGAMSLGI